MGRKCSLPDSWAAKGSPFSGLSAAGLSCYEVQRLLAPHSLVLDEVSPGWVVADRAEKTRHEGLFTGIGAHLMLLAHPTGTNLDFPLAFMPRLEETDSFLVNYIF